MRDTVLGLMVVVIASCLLCLLGCTGNDSQIVGVQPGGVESATLPTTFAVSPSSLPVPDGVEPELWQQLATELERQLIALRGASRVGDGLILRSASTPPTRPRSQAVLSATETKLQWGYYSNGDYDQNGEVNVADLTPIAIHFMETAGTETFPPNSIQDVIDGDDNGEINLADITPIAINFQNNVARYNVYRSQDSTDYPAAPGDGNGGATPVTSLLLNTAVGGRGVQRLQFSSTLPAGLNEDYFWVRPADNEAVEGIASNLAGPLTNIYTLDGHVFMAGGGTDPLPGVPVGLSGDATASTVTDENGYYSFEVPGGEYTITPTGDPYGYSPETIAATVTNTDKHLAPIYPAPVDIVHTWVAEDTLSLLVFATAIDGQDNVYLAGNTEWAGEPVVFVLKYDMFGNLLWSSVQQFGLQIIVRNILLEPAGNIYVAGSYKPTPDDGPNVQYEDVFILKLDSSGGQEWLFSYTSPTPHSTDLEQRHRDVMGAMAFDPQGNLVVGGDALGMADKPGFYLKVNPDGELVEERYLSLENDDFRSLQTQGLGVDPLGNIFTSGELGRPFQSPAYLMKVDTNGQIIWLNHWGSEFVSYETQDIKLGADGSVFAVSDIQNNQPTLSNTHLAKVTPDGAVSWEVQVTRETKMINPDLAIGPMGKLWVSQTEVFDAGNVQADSVPFLMSYGQNGNLRFARRWYDAESYNRSTINDIAVNSYGVAVMVGHKGIQQGTWETPEVTLDYLPMVQSTQSVIDYSATGIVNPALVVTDFVLTGEEDNPVYEQQAVIMYYRP